MTTETQITLRARLREMRSNIAFIDVTIENANGECCTEGEAIYFTYGEEKARAMGFVHCDVEDEQLLSM